MLRLTKDVTSWVLFFLIAVFSTTVFLVEPYSVLYFFLIAANSCVCFISLGRSFPVTSFLIFTRNIFLGALLGFSTSGFTKLFVLKDVSEDFLISSAIGGGVVSLVILVSCGFLFAKNVDFDNSKQKDSLANKMAFVGAVLASVIISGPIAYAFGFPMTRVESVLPISFLLAAWAVIFPAFCAVTAVVKQVPAEA